MRLNAHRLGWLAAVLLGRGRPPAEFPPPAGPGGGFLLLEDGTYLLLEDGGRIEFEHEAVVPPAMDGLLLLEDGSFLLAEDGATRFRLEQEAIVEPPRDGAMLMEDGASRLVLEDGVTGFAFE